MLLPPFLPSTALAWLITLAAVTGRADPGRGDDQKLAELEELFARTGQFTEDFWRTSKRLADARGTEIVHAVMVRAHGWKEEEGLIFVPLLALTPREETLRILRSYERSPRGTERHWAREFAAEFELADTKAGVRKFSASK